MAVVTSADYLKDRYLNTWTKGDQVVALTPEQKAAVSRYIIQDERLAELYKRLSKQYRLQQHQGTILAHPAEQKLEGLIHCARKNLQLELTSVVRLEGMVDLHDIDKAIAYLQVHPTASYEELTMALPDLNVSIKQETSKTPDLLLCVNDNVPGVVGSMSPDKLAAMVGSVFKAH